MKKVFVLLVVVCSMFSCASNRTYVKDYSKRIELVKKNFPEIYKMYCNGVVAIDNVYITHKDGGETVHISYRYI